MTQEYLFSDKDKKDEVKEYRPTGIGIEITDIKDSDCWIAAYSIPHEDEVTARKLSEIDEHIVNTFRPTVLKNESAAYFNKRLYPLANDFERKLRKYLYLKSALNPTETAYENIKDLEAKDLGKIFELLFTDPDFVKATRSMINNEKSWQFTKAELYSAIDKINENPFWNKLIGKETVPELSTNFLSVKNYRNAIMHAHNVSYSVYNAAQNLFQKINKQLDIEISKIIAVTNKPLSEPIPQNYNAVLSDALTNMNYQSCFNELAQKMTAFQMTLPPALLELQERMSNLAKMQPSSFQKLAKLFEELKKETSYLDSSKPDDSIEDKKSTNKEEPTDKETEENK